MEQEKTQESPEYFVVLESIEALRGEKKVCHKDTGANLKELWGPDLKQFK